MVSPTTLTVLEKAFFNLLTLPSSYLIREERLKDLKKIYCCSTCIEPFWTLDRKKSSLEIEKIEETVQKKGLIHYPFVFFNTTNRYFTYFCKFIFSFLRFLSHKIMI
eukprot:GHVP01070973.1.p1 GENE.GHVP01070973.1~~GHVP01070973.1.p1  ORF type:complete len:107 (-),score=6.26 GHVP01070973.1:16-336(-)